MLFHTEFLSRAGKVSFRSASPVQCRRGKRALLLLFFSLLCMSKGGTGKEGFEAERTSPRCEGGSSLYGYGPHWPIKERQWLYSAPLFMRDKRSFRVPYIITCTCKGRNCYGITSFEPPSENDVLRAQRSLCNEGGQGDAGKYSPPLNIKTNIFFMYHRP